MYREDGEYKLLVDLNTVAPLNQDHPRDCYKKLVTIVRGVKIHRCTGMYLDTGHEICISYHAKIKFLYRDSHSPLHTQTVGDLQGRYCNIPSFFVA